MKKSKIIIYICLILGYILIINFIANFIVLQDFSLSNFSMSQIIGGENQKIGIGQSVSVNIVRPRPYGSIIEGGGISKINFLGIIPFPLTIKGINFVYFHLIFAAVIIFLLYRDLGKAGEDGKKVDNGMNQYNKLPSPNF